MNLLNSLYLALMKNRLSQIKFFNKNPEEVQERVLKKLIAQARNTEWGKRYGYSQIQNLSDYQRNVPVSQYEDIVGDIRRMMRGEVNVLWRGKIQRYSKSSGTTDHRSKFIPVSSDSLKGCHYKGGKDLYALYLKRYPGSRLLYGKSLGIGGSMQKHDESTAICGDISALLMKYLPWWAKTRRTPHITIALMKEWDTKIQKIIATTQKEYVTSIAGVPTWILPLLRAILEKYQTNNLLDIWKGFELFVHGAVSFRPYRKVFQELLPSSTKYVEVYNASEGFFGIQDNDELDTMLLMLDYGVFYEFLDMSHPNASPVSIGEVKKGISYALIISTNGGLWRYQIGDTIRFTSLYPHRFQITGRTKHFINAFGEEVVIENAEKALLTACRNTDAQVAEYSACPIFLESRQKGGHEWVIEFTKQPKDLTLFSKVLDNTLREINSDYDAKRFKEIAMRLPLIHSVKKGTFYEWFRISNKMGGQNKIPRLSNSREYVESLLKIVTPV